MTAGSAVVAAVLSAGTGEGEQALVIDWEQLPTYNTVMSVAVEAGLLLVVALGRQVLTAPGRVSLEGHAVAFAVLGSLLVLTGAHMTLTWPLAPAYPFDNIIYGEPALAFGVILVVTAVHLWRRGPALQAQSHPVQALARAYLPLSVFVVGIGLGMIAIAVAGVRYELFAAPPLEPVSGAFADYPLVEAVFISGLYALTGLGAVLSPWCCDPSASAWWPGRWGRSGPSPAAPSCCSGR